MDSSDLRMIIAGLFAAFLVVIVIDDLFKRMKKNAPKVRKARERGFQRGKPQTPTQPVRSWKADRSGSARRLF